MKRYIISSLLLILLFGGCSLTFKEKMTITSSSDEAIKLYIKGSHLANNLRNSESQTLFEKAVELDPEFALAYLRLAVSGQSPKDFFDNLTKAKSLIENVSEGERLWILAVEAGANGQPNEQREYFEKLGKLYPKDEQVLMLLGNFYYGLQRFDLALVEYKKIIELDENYTPVYNMLGYTYRSLQNFTEAENNFKKYIDLIPNDPNPYDSYAELLMKMARFDESIKYYKKSLEVNPYFVASHIGIASDLNYLGEHVQARNELHEYFERAKDDNQRRAALFSMAVSHIDEGNYILAIKILMKSKNIAEKNNDVIAVSQVLGNIAFIYLEMNKIDEAEKYYKESFDLIMNSRQSVLVKDATERTSLFIEGRLALARNDFDNSKQFADKFLDEATQINNIGQIRLGHQLLGMIALKEKDYEKALVELRQANQQDPYNLYRIALAYEGAGDSQTASGFYQKVVDFNPLNAFNYGFYRFKALEKINL